MERFDIYLRGFVGSEPADLGLQRVFGIDQRRARELLKSLPRVVKRDVPGEHADRYLQALSAIGADFELRRSPIRPQRVIAVTGGDATEELEQHGATLSLSLSLPFEGVGSPHDTLVDPPRVWPDEHAAPPQVTIAAYAAPYAPEPAHSAPAMAPMRDSRSLGATLSESRPPPAYAAAAPAASSAPPSKTLRESQRAPAVVWPGALADTMAESRQAPQPVHRARGPATVSESQPTSAARVPAGEVDFPAPPGLEAQRWGDNPRHASVRPPSGPAAPPSAAPPVSARPLSSAWAPIPPAELALPASPPDARQWDANSLDVRGRPAWLAEGSGVPRADMLRALHRASAAEPDESQIDAGARAPRTSVPPLASRPPRSARPDAAPVPGRPGVAPHVGTVAGRELRPDDAPAALRWAIRVGIGMSLFVIATTARHCHPVDRDVEKALAAWGGRGEGEPAVGGALDAPADSKLGPAALPWLASEVHQFSNGDKDRVRVVVQKFERTGAHVYVGSITHMGPAEISGELIVQLPEDEAARQAAIAVYQQFQASSFGAFSQEVTTAPKGDLLRLTL